METPVKASPDSQGEALLFLYLPTGGGHVSAARSLDEALARQNPAHKTYIADPLTESPGFVRRLIEDGYTTTAVKFPWLWPIVYQISVYWPMMAFQTFLMQVICTGYIRRYIRRLKIDRVVILHFLLIKPVRRALAQLGRPDLPVLTVVTDPFTIHPLWAHGLRGPVCTFSPESSRRLKRRLPGFLRHPVDVHLVPPLIRPAFRQALDPEQARRLRRAEGFDPERPLVLLAGGGDGLPGGPKVLQALTRLGSGIQICVVCGKNRLQLKQCQKIARMRPQHSIQVHGFVSHMYQLMNMADAVVAKGGPATVFEVLSLGKPLFICSYFYGQEQGNVNYVLRHHLGAYQQKPKLLAKAIATFLQDQDSLAESCRPNGQCLPGLPQAPEGQDGAAVMVNLLLNLPPASRPWNTRPWGAPEEEK